MKTLLKKVIFFLLILNINAQSIERDTYKININQSTKNTLKLNQKLKIKKGLYMDVSPQFGNLFITRFEAIKAKINSKEFYNDFDFGLKMGFNFLLKGQLSFKAIYNIGMLKFDKPDNLKDQGYNVQLSIDYVF